MKIKISLIEDFTDYLRFERRYSANTIESYNRDLRKYFFFLEQEKINDFKQVNHEVILHFLQITFNNQSDKSVNRILSTIRTFYKFMLGKELVKENPFIFIANPKVPKKDIHILDQAEVQDFLEKIPTSSRLELRDRAMFELLYSSGLRASEVVNLRLQDLDAEEGLVRFVGKGNKERILPVGEKALEFLLKYLGSARFDLEKEKKNDYFFLNRSGKRITRQGFWKILKKYMKKYDCPKNLYPHLFRHSFATHLLQEGADLRLVQELLGHSSISTTEIYTNLDKKHIKDSYFKHHPRGKIKA